MNAVILNVLFGAVMFAIAVGIPIVGLLWQRQESIPDATATSRGNTEHREPNRPVPANAWLTDRELVDAHQRAGSR